MKVRKPPVPVPVPVPILQRRYPTQTTSRLPILNYKGENPKNAFQIPVSLTKEINKAGAIQNKQTEIKSKQKEIKMLQQELKKKTHENETRVRNSILKIGSKGKEYVLNTTEKKNLPTVLEKLGIKPYDSSKKKALVVKTPYIPYSIFFEPHTNPIENLQIKQIQGFDSHSAPVNQHDREAFTDIINLQQELVNQRKLLNQYKLNLKNLKEGTSPTRSNTVPESQQNKKQSVTSQSNSNSKSASGSLIRGATRRIRSLAHTLKKPSTEEILAQYNKYSQSTPTNKTLIKKSTNSTSNTNTTNMATSTNNTIDSKHTSYQTFKTNYVKNKAKRTKYGRLTENYKKAKSTWKNSHGYNTIKAGVERISAIKAAKNNTYKLAALLGSTPNNINTTKRLLESRRVKHTLKSVILPTLKEVVYELPVRYDDVERLPLNMFGPGGIVLPNIKPGETYTAAVYDNIEKGKQDAIKKGVFVNPTKIHLPTVKLQHKALINAYRQQKTKKKKESQTKKTAKESIYQQLLENAKRNLPVTQNSSYLNIVPTPTN